MVALRMFNLKKEITMNRKRFGRLSLVLSLAAFSLLCLSITSVEAKKKKVAVFPFDDGSLKVWWSGAWNPGSGIAEMIVTTLVNSKAVDVVERQELDKILAEQKLSLTGITAGTIEPGKVKGVDLIITGKVTEFVVDQKGVKAGGLNIGKLGGLGVSMSDAKCTIDARMIDTSTGAILVAATGKGKESKKGFDIQSVNWASLQFTGSDFQATILGKATRTAVDEVVKKLMETIGQVKEGKVVGVSGDKILINFGKGEIEPGTILKIFRVGEQITDPDTGESLGAEEQEIGEIKVSEVQEKFSKAIVVKTTGEIQKGDTVRVQK